MKSEQVPLADMDYNQESILSDFPFLWTQTYDNAAAKHSTPAEPRLSEDSNKHEGVIALLAGLNDTWKMWIVSNDDEKIPYPIGFSNRHDLGRWRQVDSGSSGPSWGI